MDNEEFKSKYISYEARIRNFYNAPNVKDVIIQKSDDGRSYRKIINGVYYILTTGDEYEKYAEAAQKVKQERLEIAKTEKERREQLAKERKNYSVFSYMSEEQMDKYLEPFESKESRKKKNIAKKPKKIRNNKKFKIAGLKVFAVVAAVGSIFVAKNEMNNYKERVALDSLSQIKEQLNAEQIWDNSTRLSSNSGIMQIEIIGKSVDGQTPKIYYFTARTDDGDITVRKDTIKNIEVVNAVRDVANAQNGNIFEAIKAEKTVNDMKENPSKYVYSGNVEKVFGEQFNSNNQGTIQKTVNDGEER